MALRAQSQCRATLETLAAIKNPAVVFAKQANVTTEPQQINNAVAAASPAREIETGQTQLLGATVGERVDAGTAGATSGGDPVLEAVGTVNRAKDAGR